MAKYYQNLENASRGDRYLSHSNRHTQVPVPLTTKVRDYVREFFVPNSKSQIESNSSLSIYFILKCEA